MIDPKNQFNLNHIHQAVIVYHNISDITDKIFLIIKRLIFQIQHSICQQTEEPFLLEIIERTNELICFIKYSERFYQKQDIQQLANHYLQILESLNFTDQISLQKSIY